MPKSKKRKSGFNGWLRRERKDTDNSKLIYKKGDKLFTIHDKQVIPFMVDACKAAELMRGGGVANYYCNCEKHKLPMPTSPNTKGYRMRLRQNHNLFTTKEEAQSYIDKYLKQVK